jgi:lipoate-protein ligase A
MLYFDKTFDEPQYNLACDEFLVDFCRQNGGIECLRFWEPRNYFVVLGYGNTPEDEIFVDECRRLNIPILKRVSGGGCVLQGPGCLNYALILKIENHPEISTIPDTNRFVMNKNCKILSEVLNANVKVSGITDLTINDKKFSGNAQRRYKDYVLYHGTFLINFDISPMEKILKIPKRQPCYRKNRTHSEFLTNLGISTELIKEKMKIAWEATIPLTELDTSSFINLAKNRLITET